jgi:PAS domain S-box-containing protein
MATREATEGESGTLSDLDGSEALRRCVRDLVALSTLAAIWSRASESQIAEGLGEILVRTLALDLVYVRIRGSNLPDLVTVHEQQTRLDGEMARAAAAALEPWLVAADVDEVRLAPHPIGEGRLRLVVLPLGYQEGIGMLAAGSARPDFPNHVDRLLLSVAANQAAVVLQRRQSEELLRRSESELSDFFENAAVGIHWVGPDGTILRTNQAELDLLGYQRDEYVGHNIAEFHVDRPAIEGILQRLAGGEMITGYEACLRCKDGAMKDVVIDSNVKWEDGRFVNTRCFTRDVTERRRAERTARFLADASSALSELSGQESTLRRIAGLAVPHFADWCAVDLAGADGSLRRLAGTHADPRRAAMMDLLASRYPPRPDDRHGPGRVLRTGQSEWIGRVDEGDLAAMARDGEHLELLRSLDLESCIYVPVRSRTRTVGVLSFACTASKRQFGESDLRAAEDLADRTAIAIDNANLLHALTEADRRKDEFLAMLAHELRNPLAPIRNAVEILNAKGPVVPELQWARAVIGRQIAQMGRLVDDLLDVSRISRGKIELRKERVALASVIGGALEATRPTAEKWGHELTVVLPAEPLEVEGDVVRLGQVVLNLVDNACKYTDRGGRISLRVERDGAQAVIRVRDSGIGIPPEMLGQIFDMFTQVDRSLDRAQGGLGIGLTLVNRLVELHGGSVEAFSEGSGKGSEFVVRLPLAGAAARSGENGADEPAAPLSRPRRILVVDDNRDSADSLALLLGMQGHEVRTRYDGLGAVEEAAVFRPHVALLDIGLPGLNGYEAARRIREGVEGKEILLVAITGWGQEEDRLRSEQAGFDRHITKPVALRELNSLLSALLR